MRGIPFISAAALIASIPTGTFCQATSATAPPAFEAVSVLPNTAGGPRGPIRTKPEGIAAHNVTLKQLMGYAYDLQPSQIFGPAWIDTERYDVTAEANSPASPAQLRSMLRRLLGDRFGLKTRREMKELPICWLVVAEGGPKLGGVKEEEAFNAEFAAKSPFKPGVDAIFTSGDLAKFASRLSRGIDRPVIDKTGIKGRFWFSLEWMPEKNQPYGPPLLAAIQEQLGLKLEDKKALTEVLVVDSAAKP
jgi:uncharacterized protein (TIGR03435 family)